MDTAPQTIRKSQGLSGDIFGGVAAMMVALPSAIAFGLVIYAPLGPALSGKAAVAGVLGTIAVGLVAALFGRTAGLISAPCAPAAAVLSVFVAEFLAGGNVMPEAFPLYLALVAAGAGAVQFAIGRLGGGALIKYIPYPVVAGYLSGVGVLIFTAQFPKFLGTPKGTAFIQALASPDLWQWQSAAGGMATIAAMLLAPRFIRAVPAAIVALFTGVVAYFSLSFIDPALRNLNHNPFIIGPIAVSPADLVSSFTAQWSLLPGLDLSVVTGLLVPLLTLAVLLSVDTLKTCVVLDALTGSRHNSNREITGQGLSNMASGLLGGIPGAGTMGATLVNLSSGGRTWRSGLFMGLSALLVLLVFGRFIAWIPVAALAGILLVVAVRMVDRKSIELLRHPSTRLDFAVILAVVVAAVTQSLITAAGVGIAMAILLFLRQQIRTPVVRRFLKGGQIFSKKVRTTAEQEALESRAGDLRVAELQGQLFFGTMDQLLTELEPHLAGCRYLILDMRRVQSLDYTAANRLKQIMGRLSAQQGELILASVPRSLPSGQDIRDYLERLGLSEAKSLHFFADLDAALVYAEEALLDAAGAREAADGKKLGVADLELFCDFPADALLTVRGCLEERSYRDGDTVFRAGEAGEEMFIIRSGTVRIDLPLSGGAGLHVASFAAGSFFGELAFLDRDVRSAHALAEGPAELYRLSRSAFDRATASHPEAARLLFERLANVISHRLRQNNAELKALQEN